MKTTKRKIMAVVAVLIGIGLIITTVSAGNGLQYSDSRQPHKDTTGQGICQGDGDCAGLEDCDGDCLNQQTQNRVRTRQRLNLCKQNIE